MRVPSNEVMLANAAIERALANSIFLERGELAQGIVGYLRHLVEHVTVLSVYGDSVPFDDYYKAIQQASKEAAKTKALRFLADFHKLLQKVVSHYVPSETSSERLLLRYWEYMFLLRRHAKDKFGMDILDNLDRFPLYQDATLQSYYDQVSEKLEALSAGPFPRQQNGRFYICSSRPFYAAGQMYYQVSFCPALDRTSKFDRIVAFTKRRIPSNYSVSLTVQSSDICLFGTDVPVTLIVDWSTSIRPCEINALLRVVGLKPEIKGSKKEYRTLMRILDESGLRLDEICGLNDDDYRRLVIPLSDGGGMSVLCELFSRCRHVIRNNLPGANVLRYLLCCPRGRVIRSQYNPSEGNRLLSGLFLRNGCIPFDANPFSSSLIGHRAMSSKVFSCIESEGREADIFARYIYNLTEGSSRIYASEEDVDFEGNPDSLISAYNASLYSGHVDRRIVHENGQFFLKGSEEVVFKILKTLVSSARQGVKGYTSQAISWLEDSRALVDDPLKEAALRSLFSSTMIACVFGSAGTGKTQLVQYVCAVMAESKKIAIAGTNPAVDNLRLKVFDSNCDFMTISAFLKGSSRCHLLIVDECSTVSNRDMLSILESGRFEALLLVGDIRQIEAIDFGNWFELSRFFLPDECLFELTKPWRTKDEMLLRLWASVRDLGNDITEILEANQMSFNLDGSLFERQSADEIVLCLGYEGIYGINSINRVLQSRNPNPPVIWGVHEYRVGDPVLFNESNRFFPLLYNNLKGTIVAIQVLGSDLIQFTVRVDRRFNEFAVGIFPDLEYVGEDEGRPVVRLSVKAVEDQDNEDELACVVPFQIAYAISIHKAQGLEYESVKVVITKDVEDSISHDIFYTAITRSRSRLSIHWTPETQNKVLRSLQIPSCNKDASVLANRKKLKLCSRR